MSEPLAETSVPVSEEISGQRRRWLVVAVVGGVFFLLAMIGLVGYALLQDPATTATIRDIVIIFLALESVIIGLALIILIVQVASLINLLRNEVRPILQATSETVNTLRGTTEFLSENVVEPVIRLNSYLAGLRRLFHLFGGGK